MLFTKTFIDACLECLRTIPSYTNSEVAIATLIYEIVLLAYHWWWPVYPYYQILTNPGRRSTDAFILKHFWRYAKECHISKANISFGWGSPSHECMWYFFVNKETIRRHKILFKSSCRTCCINMQMRRISFKQSNQMDCFQTDLIITQYIVARATTIFKIIY
jgi:hypothetical protein